MLEQSLPTLGLNRSKLVSIEKREKRRRTHKLTWELVLQNVMCIAHRKGNIISIFDPADPITFAALLSILTAVRMVNLHAIERSWVILPKISGTLSCIGSALVGRHIAKKGLKEASLTSHMLFCISIVDFICSFFVYFLSSWMAPRGTLPYAAGNQATCNVQGFMFVFELAYFATAYAELAAICKCLRNCYHHVIALMTVPRAHTDIFCHCRLANGAARMDTE